MPLGLTQKKIDAVSIDPHVIVMWGGIRMHFVAAISHGEFVLYLFYTC